MASPVAKALAVGAAFFGGLQAGVTANRALVQMPAWERLGVISWANFARAENHGLGSAFYPAVGLAAVAFPIALVIVFRRDKTREQLRGLPVYLAAASVVVWASITRAVLVPAMFHLRDLADNVNALEPIFSTVVQWSAVNDVLHVIAFGLNLWALIVVFSGSNAKARLTPLAQGLDKLG